MCIFAKFSTFSRSWKPILKINAFSYFLNHVGTLWNNNTFLETQYMYRGLTRRGKGVQIPGRWITWGGRTRALNHFGEDEVHFTYCILPFIKNNCFLPFYECLCLFVCWWFIPFHPLRIWKKRYAMYWLMPPLHYQSSNELRHPDQVINFGHVSHNGPVICKTRIRKKHVFLLLG